nr:Lrp/AsnC family transcriptional regulator [Maliibacterium massiliense]
MQSKLDMDILEILMEDARTTPEQIAVMLGEEPQHIKETIARMEQEGVIIKYRALLNWEKLDTDLVEAWIEVRVTPQMDAGFDAIAEKIYRYPEVKALYLMSGPFDLMVRVEGHNLKNVAMFVSQKLSLIEGVQSTATHFLLKRYKSDGVVLEKKSTDRRLVVSP